MQKGARTGDRRLYDNDSVRSVSHIGPYLVAMPDIVVRKRNRPISSLAEMTYESMSNDNNNFTLTSSEYHALRSAHEEEDRKSVVEGKSVSVRVDLGGRRNIKKKTNKRTQ